MARVVLVRRATRQAELIDTWWRENRTAAPDLFLSELEAAIEALEVAPEMGQRVAAPPPGVRRLLLRATQFHLFYYDIEDGTVRILAVWSSLRGRGPELP